MGTAGRRALGWAFTVAPLVCSCVPGGDDAGPRFPPAWGISSEPLVTLGDGSASVAAFQRVAGVGVDGRGRIIVVDGAAALVRVFASDGRYLETYGGPGEGPGEYSVPRLLEVIRGDSIAVLDWSRETLTVLSAQGAPGRTHVLMGPEQPTPIQALATLDDGRLVVQAVALHRGELGEGTVLSDTVNLALLDPENGDATPLGPAVRIARVWTGQDLVPLPFAPQLTLTTRADTVFTLDAEGASVLVYTADGLAGSWLPPRVRPLVSEAHHEAYAREVRERVSDPEAAGRRLGALAHPAVPVRAPVYDRLVATDGGEVWARVWDVGAEVRVWDAYDAAGTFLGTVRTPVRLTVHQVTPSVVAGVWREGPGAESVRVFELQRAWSM